jgi:hypothetical protein
MREASKPIAWYANILVSLPVESGQENQHMLNGFNHFNIENLAINNYLNKPNKIKDKPHLYLNR